ncbi:hypothetical protein BC835DRAFT_23485 [Cytidiella melzeri]|nr:hypothetical protein BC835DRAFT_23485 [Cytidiella melzeri]
MKKATVQFAPEKLNSSPLVYPSPRVPTTNRLNTHKTTGPAVHSSKPSFRRLDTDRSDEILDFEDPTVHASPLQDVPEGSKAKLGKRNRPVEVKSPHGGRHTKKLRTGVRTRSIAQQQVDADSSVNQSLEPLAANSRIRKRR